MIHCSASRCDRDYSFEALDKDHRSRGWNGCGYHYVIRRSGDIEVGRPENVVGAHCYNYNRNSIGVCYEGGLDAKGKPADTRTPEQKKAMLNLLTELKKKYPNAVIVGHNEFSNKACPCFDAAEEYKDLKP